MPTGWQNKPNERPNARVEMASAVVLSHLVGSAPVRLWPAVYCGSDQAQTGTDDGPARGDRYIHGECNQPSRETHFPDGIGPGGPLSSVRTTGVVASVPTRS